MPGSRHLLVEPVDQDQHGTDHKSAQIDEQETDNGAQGALVHDPAVEPTGITSCGWMARVISRRSIFWSSRMRIILDCARGGAGASADEHQHHQRQQRQYRPGDAALANPVVVMTETTWNAAWRIASWSPMSS